MRKLLATEIDVRVGQVGDGWATLLLYKDARVDMTLLDEEFGKLGWKREHREINGNLYCKISVWDKENKQWVDREDVGVESNTEKEKGQASDSFKRAGVNFGIGRELYTGPRISINVETKDMGGRKFKLANFDSYKVDTIEYTDVISALVIKNKNGSTVFTFPKRYQAPKDNPVEPLDDESDAPTQEQIDQIKALATLKGTPANLITARLKQITTSKEAEIAINKLRS
jgi:hypothetical protein